MNTIILSIHYIIIIDAYNSHKNLVYLINYIEEYIYLIDFIHAITFKFDRYTNQNSEITD